MRVGARITAATSLVITITLGVYAYFDLRGSARDRLAAVESEAHEVAAAVRASIETAEAMGAAGNVASIAQRVNRTTRWQVAILPRTLLDAPTPPPEVTAAQIRRLRTLVEAPDLKLSVNDDGLFIHVTAIRVPTLSPEGYRVSGTLEISRSTADLDQAKRNDLLRTLPVLAVIVVLTLLVITLFTRSLLTRPVGQLLSGIDDVARGDLSRVLLSERDDEIGALATRFNEMTYSLRESHAETQRQNDARLHLEQRLGQTEKLATLGQLAAEIAHEVGTPLNVIAGRARTMARKADDRAAVEKNSEIIAEQTARITKIIQRLLDFVRRKVGTTEPQRVNVNELALTTMELLEGQFASARVKTRLDRADGLPAVAGDADRLQQVLLNLFINAMQAMPDGGRLTVETTTVTRRRPGLESAPNEAYVEVSVADTGVGIPLERRESIFDPFYTSREGEGGTGLGLAVCAGIVKDHDGFIELEDGADRGTVFRVFLPVAAQDRAMQKADA